jgi:predicted 3-demethylubiquinone-9 3-methyltransferase (glyoxalase superfamily)
MSAMAIVKNKIASCLWYDNQAEEAAKFYVSVFKNSKVGRTSYYSGEAQEVHGHANGHVLTVEFELDGQKFVALNGGPQFKFSEAISFQVFCEDQKEIDYYWDKLREGGGQESQCGWLKDRFGLSWQVVYSPMIDMLHDKDRAKVDRVFAAFMPMKKFDVAALEKAYAG